MEECIPKAALPSKRNQPWLTKRLIQAIRRRNFIHKCAKATKTIQNINLTETSWLTTWGKLRRPTLGSWCPKQFWKVCKLLNCTNSTIPTLVHGNTNAQKIVQKQKCWTHQVLCIMFFNKSQSPVESTDLHISAPSDDFPSELLCSEDEISDLLSSLDVSKSNGPGSWWYIS